MLRSDYEKSPVARNKKDNFGASAIVCVKIKNSNMKALDLATLEAYAPTLQGFLSDVCNQWLEDWMNTHEDTGR